MIRIINGAVGELQQLIGQGRGIGYSYLSIILCRAFNQLKYFLLLKLIILFLKLKGKAQFNIVVYPLR